MKTQEIQQAPQKFRCLTEEKIKKNAASIDKIRVGIRTNSGEVVIPLWGKTGTSKQLLSWEFDDDSVEDYFLNQRNSRDFFRNQKEAKKYIRTLISEAMQLWGDASPFTLQEKEGITDFKIKMMTKDDCTPDGCILASAFFPNETDGYLDLYPILFKQTKKEQIETIVHEFGHIKGLRHSFAHISETNWPSELFGHDSQLSIMNYGVNSELTSVDKEDLKKLYQAVWSKKIVKINNMPVQLCYTKDSSPQD